MHLSPGDRLGRYEVLSLLGKGGMGEVYRARDSELDRLVAIKVLPDAVAEDPSRLARFKREAKAVAKLSHASILEIFDFGEQDGITFAVTELLEGETLRELLDSRGEGLPWKRASEIAASVADGLATAHANGVVHRDIKPGNLFLCSDGRIKILDFGLASLRTPAPEAEKTTPLSELVSTPGVILGTVGYMSPEQIRGEPADTRTDIFALGCVIYEMLAKRRPFERKSSVDTLSAILRDDPEPLGQSGVHLIPELEEIVQRCLEKDPGRRFQSASDLAFAIRSATDSTGRSTFAAESTAARPGWLVPSLAILALIVIVVAGIMFYPRSAPVSTDQASIRSIAVLPLDNLSGDSSQDYFADGMTEALITRLSKIGALKVISRTSVMRFRDTTLSLPEIASELGVDAVLTGSVQREGSRVRINAQLIDGRTDQHVWADAFEREVKGVLALQSEVARAIAAAVAVELSPGEATRLAESRDVNPEIYEMVLRGMHMMKKGTPEDFHEGMSYLQGAVDEDPADPLAYSGLASAYVTMGHETGDAEAFQKAKAAALRAIELNPNAAEAQGVLAEVELYYEWNWEAAALAFEKALEMNPNLAAARAHHAALFMLHGEWDKAIAEMNRARQLDPLAPVFTQWVGEVYWGTGRYEEAIDEEKKALELNPELHRARAILGLALMDDGRPSEALEALRGASEAIPIWNPMFGRALLATGQHEEAAALLEELTGNPGYPVNPVLLANFQAAFGDLDGAIATLEKGSETRNGLMPWIGSWFDWSNLAGDPRYEELLAKMNLEYFPRPSV